MGTSANRPLARWTAPECPFSVEYSPQVLDEIRLAVLDAFFSLPRGGTEIGGILLGRVEKGSVTITDWIAVECEHAHGPSFTLSETDQSRFSRKLAEAARNGDSGVRPVGWYHSHTRSDIFLSEADVKLHNRFFPEPWQLALVLKPHALLPTRAGFFFREGDGSIRADESYREIALEPLPIGNMTIKEPPRPVPVPEPLDLFEPEPEPEPEPMAETAPEPEPVFEPVEETPAPPAGNPLPAFAAGGPERPRRRWMLPAVVTMLAALGVAAFLSREAWLGAHPAPAMPAVMLAQASVGLTAADHDGQLQIHWDPKAPEIGSSTGALLLISDGALPRTVALDAGQLRSGSYADKHSSDRVTVILSLSQRGGSKLVQAAAIEPKVQAPAPAPPPVVESPNPALKAENAHLKGEVTRLKAQNDKFQEANHRMEQYIETDRAEHQKAGKK